MCQWVVGVVVAAASGESFGSDELEVTKIRKPIPQLTLVSLVFMFLLLVVVPVRVLL